MRCLRWFSFLFVALLLIATGGCGDDDGGMGPGGDTISPTVISIYPESGDTGVALDEEYIVVFSEAMDPASATGSVTLSVGSITELLWLDDQTLKISHSTWPEGTLVTLSLTSGLKDLAGNGLDVPFSLSLWTFASQLKFLTSDPPDKATDVLVNTSVKMLFSARMDLSSLAGAISVNAPAKAPIPYVLERGDGDWVSMFFSQPLPEDTGVRIDITTQARSTSGLYLTEAASIAFTTGKRSDTTPPKLLSVEPRNGASISPNTKFVRFTFDEPIDPSTFEPSMLSAHFFLMVEYSGSAPVWSAGGTVLTVALLTPMPSGIPLAARIPTYRDLAGNVQTLPIEYEVKVSGTPDYWPFADGIVYAWEGAWVEGDKEGIIDGGTTFEIQRMEVQSSSTFHLTSYETMDFIDPRGWDAYRRTSNAIQLLGYRETDMSVVKDVDLDPDVDFARLPWSVQTWAGTAMAVSPGSSRTIEYSMEVVAQEDLPLFPIELKKGAALWKQPTNIEVLWMDCWKQVLTYTMRESGSIVQSGTESMWFAPAIGRVRVEARQESPDGTYEESKSYLSGLIIPGWLEP